MVRLFATYAVISVVPVLVLGLVLAGSYRHEAEQRGLAEGRSEAVLIATTAVEPLLDGEPFDQGLSAAEQLGLRRMTDRSVREGSILRLRVRDLHDRVLFSDDGSGLQSGPDHDATVAAHGQLVVQRTSLNVDGNDVGPTGASAVEAYVPLRAGSPERQVGVLELYLPYAPIDRDVSAGLSSLYHDLKIGLVVLYLALFAITASVSRGLRRQATLNAFLAEHDALTDLPNRALFHRRTEAAVAEATTNAPAAIAIIDLDRFKEVNDTLGHHNGDQLLTELARRLAAHSRPGDTVARLGGDEFGVVLRNVTDPAEILLRLREVIDHEAEVSGLPLSIEASIGFVLAPDDGSDVDELLQRADVAMYLAKAQHSGVARYDPAQDHYDALNLELVAELRHAIDDGQLVLHYQPKVTLGDGRIEAVEALLRWQHPVHGLLEPDRFLPLAEQTDLIDKLTDWVLAAALQDIQLLGPRAIDLGVAVNVSARNLSRPDFAGNVARALAQSGIEPRRLIIEITETALLADPGRAAALLTELDNAGVEVSLDDFGQGQTSLGYLSALPVHELKIDKSFVHDMLEDDAHAAIVRSIVYLGHSLALRVVAEGVETEAVLAMLRTAGCDVAQGYLLARPMPIDQLGSWLTTLAGSPSTAKTSALATTAR